MYKINLRKWIALEIKLTKSEDSIQVEHIRHLHALLALTEMFKSQFLM